VPAHTTQMSAALFAAGIPHELVLIPNASHMAGTGGVVVARYLIELDFLRRSLGLVPPE
jgi:dipeptidyl-peptidase 4